jgi:hypothetical protein
VHQVHRFFGAKIRGHAPRDEQADDLAFERLGFLADDCELGCKARQLQRALDGVVIRQRDAVEPALGAALDQRI